MNIEAINSLQGAISAPARDEQYIHEMFALLKSDHAEIVAALEGLLKFNTELCEDTNVSKHYPSADKARAVLAKAKGQS